MSQYPPPNNIEPISVFNPANFMSLDNFLTVEYANKNYLKFPVAQGNENLLSVNVSGTLNANGALSANSTATFNVIPTSTAVQPDSTDTSNKIPTTAWVQSAITGGSSNTLAEVLVQGNSAGSTSINMNSQNITGVNQMTFIDGTDSLTIDQVGTDSFISNNQTSGTIFLRTKSGGGTMTNTLSINQNPNGIVALANLNMSNLSIDGIGTATYADATEQTSAYTGGTAGTYTNTNMTIDSNGKISAISSGTSAYIAIPYYSATWYGSTGPQYSGPSTINLTWADYATQSINNFMTFRLSISIIYGTTLESIYTLDCITNIYPYRLRGGTPLGSQKNNLATNSINGNTNFLMSDATYAPQGRFFWSHNIVSTGVLTAGWVQIYMTANGVFGLQFDNPNSVITTPFYVNVSCEQLSKGQGSFPAITNLNSAGWYGQRTAGFL